MDNNETPFVTLAGVKYDIPLLVPRQQREIVPALLRFTALAPDLASLTKDDYNEFLKVIFWGAIWPNKKDAHFERDLLDTNVQWQEIVAAIGVIRIRSGLFKPVTAETTTNEGEQTGEVKAGVSAT